MNKKKILVTSGGTSEYIDDVRILTNTSTGKLGAVIAHQFLIESVDTDKYEVAYVHGRNTVRPPDYYGNKLKEFAVTGVESLMEVMAKLVPEYDVVIHAMAVSDFGFKREKAVKLKSNSPEDFIEHLRKNIKVNPKIISYIKTWNPNCKLVGFKFEVGKSYLDLITIARESMAKNNCDLVIANDKAMMEQRREHIAYAISPHFEQTELLMGKSKIAHYLVKYVESI